MMRYHDVPPLPRKEAEVILASGSENQVIEALLSIAFHDPDRRWVEEQCLRFARHPSGAIRGTAVGCLGHSARIHGALDTQAVVPLLKDLSADAEIRGRVEDALDDIAMYLGPGAVSGTG